MIQFLICLFLISEAQKGDAALVAGVRDSLEVCSDIVEAVGDFLSIFETEDRRRADSLGVRVSKKLTVCRRLVELVDTFRQNYFSPMKRGRIALRLNEAQFLDAQLKSVSMKLGKTLYIASEDGDNGVVFHKKCDDQGPTVAIIESTTGAVFGGYTDATWKGNGWAKSTKAFLFRLRPTTMKFPLKRGKESKAIYRDRRKGPIFGAVDLNIDFNALTKSNSYNTGGNTYKFPTYPQYMLNDGTKFFKVKDYFVVKAIKI